MRGLIKMMDATGAAGIEGDKGSALDEQQASLVAVTSGNVIVGIWVRVVCANEAGPDIVNVLSVFQVCGRGRKRRDAPETRTVNLLLNVAS